jgi:alginate O-acetyltransferase complex protein AlgI
MLFNSAEFLVFLSGLTLLYFLLKSSHRWLLLLIASYYFYMSWQPGYILLIAFTTLVSYLSGIYMGRTTDRKVRRKWLLGSLVANLGVLFFFKYFNFFNHSVKGVLDSLSIPYGFEGFDILLPVGISFYTFQTLSYSIDVYYGKNQPEKHLGIFALYVSFFPQLVAGPIERSENLLPQLRKKHAFDYSAISSGLKRICWGLFKKVVIADRLAVLVDTAYNSPDSQGGLTLIIATLLFAFQLYTDFSAYSDIAIGSARMLGIKLMENFNHPYVSKNITEFWRRWHISLSTWLRDYLFTPIVFAKKKWGKNAVLYSIFITFTLCGLWHGPRWTYIIFGVLQGVALALELKTVKKRKLWKEKYGSPYLWFSWALTFAYTLFSFIFFRANNTPESFSIVTSMITDPLSFGSTLEYFAEFSLSRVAFVLALLTAFIALDKWLSKLSAEEVNIPVTFKYIIYSVMTTSLITFGYWGKVEFVYFQF